MDYALQTRNAVEQEFEIRMVKFSVLMYWILLAQSICIRNEYTFVPPICMMVTCVLLIFLCRNPDVETKVDTYKSPWTIKKEVDADGSTVTILT